MKYKRVKYSSVDGVNIPYYDIKWLRNGRELPCDFTFDYILDPTPTPTNTSTPTPTPTITPSSTPPEVEPEALRVYNYTPDSPAKGWYLPVNSAEADDDGSNVLVDCSVNEYMFLTHYQLDWRAIINYKQSGGAVENYMLYSNAAETFNWTCGANNTREVPQFNVFENTTSINGVLWPSQGTHSVDGVSFDVEYIYSIPSAPSTITITSSNSFVYDDIYYPVGSGTYFELTSSGSPSNFDIVCDGTNGYRLMVGFNNDDLIMGYVDSSVSQANYAGLHNFISKSSANYNCSTSFTATLNISGWEELDYTLCSNGYAYPTEGTYNQAPGETFTITWN